MIDQSAIDLLASLEQHKTSSPEVETFHHFFTASSPLKDLLFFLFARSLAERELSLLIPKLPSNQDVRNITLTAAQCKKLAHNIFLNSEEKNLSNSFYS